MKNKIKYLILVSIFITIFFSSISSTNASKISDILNINLWVEEIEYKLSELPDRNFTNSTLQKKYIEMQITNRILTKSFYKEYKNWNIDYYTTKWIIKNHNNFIHNTEMLFTYLELKIKNPKYIDVDQKIIDSYSQMRTNLNRINFLYNRSK